MSIQELVKKYSHMLVDIDIEIDECRKREHDPSIEWHTQNLNGMAATILSYKREVINGFLDDLKKVTE